MVVPKPQLPGNLFVQSGHSQLLGKEQARSPGSCLSTGAHSAFLGLSCQHSRPALLRLLIKSVGRSLRLKQTPAGKLTWWLALALVVAPRGRGFRCGRGWLHHCTWELARKARSWLLPGAERSARGAPPPGSHQLSRWPLATEVAALLRELGLSRRPPRENQVWGCRTLVIA